jgi:hypothetical protein
MLSTSKDREQVEYLINRHKETVDNLVDFGLIWSKLDTDDEYAASVTTRLSDITEKLQLIGLCGFFFCLQVFINNPHIPNTIIGLVDLLDWIHDSF